MPLILVPIALLMIAFLPVFFEFLLLRFLNKRLIVKYFILNTKLIIAKCRQVQPDEFHFDAFKSDSVFEILTTENSKFYVGVKRAMIIGRPKFMIKKVFSEGAAVDAYDATELGVKLYL